MVHACHSGSNIIAAIGTQIEMKNNFAYLINGQIIRIPLSDAFFAQIDDRDFDVRAFECHYRTRWSANVTSADATNLCYDHSDIGGSVSGSWMLPLVLSR